GRVALDAEEAPPLRGTRDDEHDVCDVSIYDEIDRPLEAPAAGLASRVTRCIVRIAAEGGGADSRPRGDVTKKPTLGLLGRRMEQRVHRKHRGREIRSAEQHSTHLFHDDRELDRPEARATVWLRYDEPGQRQLLGHALPDALVVAARGLHERAHP